MKPLALALSAFVLSALSGCDARLGLSISGDEVDLRGARLQIEVHADDGGGCSSLAFVATPVTAPLSVAVVDAGSLVVPRVGAKLIVAEASTALGVIGRGCTEVGDVNSGTAAHITITPTTSLRDLPATTPVFGAAAGTVGAVVVDANDTPRSEVQVRARVLDGFGVVLVEALLTSDDDGAVSFAPPLVDSGPVVVELVPRQPHSVADRAVLDAWVAAPLDDIVLDPGSTVVPVVLNDGPQFVAARVDDDGALAVAVVGLDGSTRNATVPGEASSLRLLGVHHHESLGGTDVARDLVWLQTSTRLLVVDLATLDVVDELVGSLSNISAVVLVGDCRAPPHHGPTLMVHDGGVHVVDVAFDRITAVTASSSLASAVRSGCVSDTSGAVRRLVVTDDGVQALGGGLASIRVAAVEPQAVLLDDASTVVHIGFRPDHTALVVRFDGGSTVLTPHRLVGDVLAPRDVDDDLPQRLPATPLFVQQGALFGGRNDVLTLLPAGGPNDSAALYGRSGSAASGVVGMCAPRAACTASLVSDVDDDGVLDLLTVVASPAEVRARIVRSR